VNGVPIADVPIHTETLPVLAHPDWRIEVLKRGRFWMWRRGSHQNRQAKYGGKFSLLSDERKRQYEHNKAKLSQVQQAREMPESTPHHGERSATDSTECRELLPIGRAESRGGERR